MFRGRGSNHIGFISSWAMLRTSLRKRLSIEEKKIVVEPLPIIAWEVYRGNEVSFNLVVNKEWDSLIVNSAKSVWQLCGFIQGEDKFNSSLDMIGGEAYLENHTFLPLELDQEGDNFLTSFFSIQLEEGERVGIQIVSYPVEAGWSAYSSSELKKATSTGTPLKKDVGGIRGVASSMLLGFGNAIIKGGEDFSNYAGGKEKGEVTTVRQALQTNARAKVQQQSFYTSLRLFVHASSKRRHKLLNAMEATFLQLSDENKLVFKELKDSEIKKRWVNRQASTDMVLCDRELSNLVVLPSRETQDRFPDIASMGLGQEEPPSWLFSNDGLLLGSTNTGNGKKDVRFPWGDKDNLCIPWSLVSRQGGGKTTMGANMAIQFLKKGYPSIVFDLTTGESLHNILSSLTEEEKKHVDVLDFSDVDSIIPLTIQEARRGDRDASANRVSSEIVDFISSATSKSNPMGLQTRRWIKLAAKTALIDPQATFYDVVAILLSDEVRNNLFQRFDISDPYITTEWEQWDKLGKRGQAEDLKPVMNRFSIFLEDDNLRRMFSCRPKGEGYNFSKSIENKRMTLIHAPADELGRDAADLVVTFIIMKIWTAVLHRTPIDDPCLLIMDEPHQFPMHEYLARRFAVQGRKHRLVPTWLIHSFEQLKQMSPNLHKLIQAGGMHYMVGSSSFDTWRDLKDITAPFTPDDMKALKKFTALTRLMVDNATPMIVNLPPPARKIGGDDWSKLASQWTRPVKEVDKETWQRYGNMMY